MSDEGKVIKYKKNSKKHLQVKREEFNNQVAQSTKTKSPIQIEDVTQNKPWENIVHAHQKPPVPSNVTKFVDAFEIIRGYLGLSFSSMPENIQMNISRGIPKIGYSAFDFNQPVDIVDALNGLEAHGGLVQITDQDVIKTFINLVPEDSAEHQFRTEFFNKRFLDMRKKGMSNDKIFKALSKRLQEYLVSANPEPWKPFDGSTSHWGDIVKNVQIENKNKEKIGYQSTRLESEKPDFSLTPSELGYTYEKSYVPTDRVFPDLQEPETLMRRRPADINLRSLGSLFNSPKEKPITQDHLNLFEIAPEDFHGIPNNAMTEMVYIKQGIKDVAKKTASLMLDLFNLNVLKLLDIPFLKENEMVFVRNAMHRMLKDQPGYDNRYETTDKSKYPDRMESNFRPEERLNALNNTADKMIKIMDSHEEMRSLVNRFNEIKSQHILDLRSPDLFNAYFTVSIPSGLVTSNGERSIVAEIGKLKLTDRVTQFNDLLDYMFHALNVNGSYASRASVAAGYGYQSVRHIHGNVVKTINDLITAMGLSVADSDLPPATKNAFSQIVKDHEDLLDNPNKRFGKLLPGDAEKIPLVDYVDPRYDSNFASGQLSSEMRSDYFEGPSGAGADTPSFMEYMLDQENLEENPDYVPEDEMGRERAIRTESNYDYMPHEDVSSLTQGRTISQLLTNGQRQLLSDLGVVADGNGFVDKFTGQPIPSEEVNKLTTMAYKPKRDLYRFDADGNVYLRKFVEPDKGKQDTPNKQQAANDVFFDDETGQPRRELGGYERDSKGRAKWTKLSQQQIHDLVGSKLTGGALGVMEEVFGRKFDLEKDAEFLRNFKSKWYSPTKPPSTKDFSC